MDNNSEVVYLYLDDVIPNRFQPREVFDVQALKELAVSIKEHGVIQPIIVRKVENKYEIIAGERRYKASTMAGLTKIPAIVKNLDDKESSKVALIENLQRKDLTPIEEARTYQKILELEDNMTQEELAATMGKTQSAVSNKLRLLALPDEIQDALLKEKISERHARSLLNIEDKNEQIKMMERVIAEKMTVRELDKAIKEGKEETPGVGEVSINNGANITIPTVDVGEPTQINPVGATDNSSVDNPFLEEKKEEHEDVPTFTIPSIPILENNNEVTNNVDNNEVTTVSQEITTIPPVETVTEVVVPNVEEVEEKPSDNNMENNMENVSINPTMVDINKIRENSVDIGGTPTTPPVAVVDNLMKDPQEENGGGFKFVQSFDNGGNNTNNQSTAPNNFTNFFDPNKNSIQPNDEQNSVASAIPSVGLTIPSVNSEVKDITTAVNDIKNTIKTLENNGYKVNFEEQDNFSNYQIIINLQKNG